MFRVEGLRKLSNASARTDSVVRFYVRDAAGRFTSNKITFMPKRVWDTGLAGELLFSNFRGFILSIKKPYVLVLDKINFQTVKVVS
jgi:hypothetical protein